jgi:hypothetical protein
MSSSQIVELIREKYPGKYCIPGASHASKAVSALVSKHKDGKEPKKRKRKVPIEIE